MQSQKTKLTVSLPALRLPSASPTISHQPLSPFVGITQKQVA